MASIKSENYFGEAWKNASPEQKNLIWQTLGQDNKENTVKTATKLSKNDVAMARRIYRAMKNAKYPQSYLDRVQAIVDDNNRDDLKKAYLYAKEKNLI